jgi:catechol 2,3-dioxygenase
MMSLNTEPIFDVAQLAHVEIFTPKPERTLWFFRDILGLSESARQGQSVYLRAYEDYYHHTLKITEAKQAGLGHICWRSSSEPALHRRVKVLEESGYGQGWIDGDIGHGHAYQFRDPDGHQMEILWDVEYYEVPADKKSALLTRPQKRPMQGVPVRRLDHINVMASEPGPCSTFMQDQLGFRLREQVFDGSRVMAAWLSVSALVHEIAFTGDSTGSQGRLHHVAYWYGIPQHIFDLAELLRENGVTIEAGPGKHGITQALFMYVYEPGGNRVELFSDSGYLIFDPTWKPVVWSMEQAVDAGLVWIGAPLPDSFWSYATPFVPTNAVIAEANQVVPVIS